MRGAATPLSAGFAALAGLSGLLALIGWAFDLPVLKGIHPSFVAMAPNTALLLLLSTLGILALVYGGSYRATRLVVAVLATVVFAISAVTLADDLFGLNSGLGHLLLPEPPPAGSRHGLMAPCTALSFLLLAGCLLSFTCHSLSAIRVPLSTGFSMAILAIAALSMLAHVAEVLTGWKMSTYSGMAVNTSLAFVAFGFAFLALLWREGSLRWELHRLTTLAFVVGLLSTFFAAEASFYFMKNLLDTDRSVIAHEQILKKTQEIMRETAAMESGQRGYIITGDESLLQEREHAKARVQRDIQQLRELLPRQPVSLDTLDEMVRKRTEFGDAVIALRRTEGFDAAASMVATRTGVELTALIDRALMQVFDSIAAELQSELRGAQSAGARTMLLLPLGVLSSITLLLVALCFLNSSTAATRAAADALDRSQSRMTGIVDTAMDAIITLDARGDIVQFNRAAEQIFQRNAQDVIGKPCTLLFPPALHAPCHEFMEAFSRSQTMAVPLQLPATLQGLRADGERFPVEGSVALLNLKGEENYTLILRDITRRRRAEEGLLEMQDRLERAVEAAHVGLWEWDIPAQRMYYSPEWKRQLGYAEDEIGDRMEEWIERIHPDDKPHLADLFQSDLANERSGFSYEFRMRAKNGDYRWMLVRGALRFDSHGRAVRLLGSNLDITERKTLEAQFLQSQKMESIGRLAGGVAHDFNNLLSVIMGYTELALGDLEPGNPLRASLENVFDAGERAAGLTRQLLAFSRQQVLEPTVLNLNRVVSEMEKMLRRLISEDITITTRLSPDLGNVLADAGQIEQIIMNLVVNARDAVGSGGRIHIETSNEILDSTYAAQHMEVKPGPYVRFAVSDTGTGISKEVIEKIFEPFFTTKEKGKGTGLGLATVYGVVKQSGGYIWVYSEEGKGTTFKIYLPRVYLPDEARPEDLQPMDTPGNQTILLVEDELMVRDLAQRILEGAGYKVIAMHDGKAAQSLSDEELRAVDLLLSDVIMPDISGPALAMQLVQRHPKLRHLYMSGYTDDAILQHGVLEQGLKFIGKPFTARNLLRKVAETLQAEVSPLA